MKLTLDDFRVLVIGALESLDDTDACSLNEWQMMLARRTQDAAHDVVPGLEEPDEAGYWDVNEFGEAVFVGDCE